jgi:hypothetical protein
MLMSMAAKEKTSSRWSAWLAPILFLLAAVAAAGPASALTRGALETRAWEKTSAPLDSRLDESLQLLNLHQQNGGAGYDNTLGSPLAAEGAGTGPVRRGESITYGESTDRVVVGDKLTGDHIPSHAAIRENVENTLDRPLTRAEDNALRNNTNTVVVDHDLHAAGNTYAGKNTPARIATDAADLNSAALRDQATHLQNAPKLGYSAQDLQQSFKALNQKNAALFSQLSTKQGIMQFFKNLGL